MILSCLLVATMTHLNNSANVGYVAMKISHSSGSGSTGNHKIMIRQENKSCTTGLLTAGPWPGQTYEANICMKLDMNKCVEFQVMNDSYYDPSHVARVSFHVQGREVSLIYGGDAGWFHSANIRGHRAC